MKMSLLEKSNYFKGLLLLLRKDNHITSEEREMMMGFSSTMGFDKTFCRQAIDTLLENEFILDEPPVFSSPEIAKSFILDGFRLACSDKYLDPKEVEFLKETSAVNGIEIEWFKETLEQFKTNKTVAEYKFLNVAALL